MESEAQLVRVWFHLESVEQEPLFRLSSAVSTALQYVATVPTYVCIIIWREERRKEWRKERGMFERKEGRRGREKREARGGREKRNVTHE